VQAMGLGNNHRHHDSLYDPLEHDHQG
jgi:hypothetical protein